MELRPCRFKRNIGWNHIAQRHEYEWCSGKFHQWAVDGSHEEGIETYGIVENETGDIFTVSPKWITFNLTEDKNDS